MVNMNVVYLLPKNVSVPLIGVLGDSVPKLTILQRIIFFMLFLNKKIKLCSLGGFSVFIFYYVSLNYFKGSNNKF